jgi:hypothetical protein
MLGVAQDLAAAVFNDGFRSWSLSCRDNEVLSELHSHTIYLTFTVEMQSGSIRKLGFSTLSTGKDDGGPIAEYVPTLIAILHTDCTVVAADDGTVFVADGGTAVVFEGRTAGVGDGTAVVDDGTVVVSMVTPQEQTATPG